MNNPLHAKKDLCNHASYYSGIHSPSKYGAVVNFILQIPIPDGQFINLRRLKSAIDCQIGQPIKIKSHSLLIFCVCRLLSSKYIETVTEIKTYDMF